MELKVRIVRHLAQKLIISTVFGLFAVAMAKAQLLAPAITVSPASTNVSNGDTVTFTITVHCNLGVLTADSCRFGNGSSWPVNALFNTVFGVLQVNSTITNTLTITNVSSASAGTYTIGASDLLGLLGLSSSATATVGILPTVTPVPSQTGMVSNGFKLAFAAPNGSNVVIEASSDFKTWVPISTNVVSGGVVSCIDAAAKAHPSRFYRAHFK